MSDCCQDKACEIDLLRKNQSRTLWIVLGINIGMFFIEFAAGFLADSTALMADSLDMLGDSLVYGLSLYVIARDERSKNLVALVKGLVMALFGLGVLFRCIYQVVTLTLPDAGIMSSTGLLALAANLLCLILLTRHRKDDLNMKSTWLCSRNDIVANSGVILAGISVYFTHSFWPDVVVSLIITSLFLKSALYVIRLAVVELRAVPAAVELCPAGTCPANACQCH